MTPGFLTDLTAERKEIACWTGKFVSETAFSVGFWGNSSLVFTTAITTVQRVISRPFPAHHAGRSIQGSLDSAAGMLASISSPGGYEQNSDANGTIKNTVRRRRSLDKARHVSHLTLPTKNINSNPPLPPRKTYLDPKGVKRTWESAERSTRPKGSDIDGVGIVAILDKETGTLAPSPSNTQTLTPPP